MIYERLITLDVENRNYGIEKLKEKYKDIVTIDQSKDKNVRLESVESIIYKIIDKNGIKSEL